MATAASLAGIEKHGSKWRYTLATRSFTPGLSSGGFPGIYADFETEDQALVYTKSTLEKLLKVLTDAKTKLNRILTDDMYEEYLNLIDFIQDDFPGYLEFEDDLCEFMLEVFTRLYDWADYNRVLLN